MDITNFNSVELIKFYRRLLHEFGLRTSYGETTTKFIYFYNRPKSNLELDYKQMLLPLLMIDYSKIVKDSSCLIFDPLNKNSLCSLLVLEDGMNYKLSTYLNNIFLIVIKKKLKINIQNVEKYSFDPEIIERLPTIDICTYNKFKNLYNILTSDSLYKGLISFSFEYSSNRSEFRIKFDYLFYEYLNLMQIKNSTLLGISLSKNEIDFFKQVYEFFIIGIIKDAFDKPIEIPKNWIEFSSLYSLVEFLKITKNVFMQYNISLDRRISRFDHTIDRSENYFDLDKIKNYLYMASDENILNIVNKSIKTDNEAYKNELKIREKSSLNLNLLKENIVAKNKDIDIQDEIINKFTKEYINTYTQKIASYFSRKDAETEIFNREYLKNSNDFQTILNMQRLAIRIIESDGGLLFFDNRDKKYYFRSDSENSITPYDKKDILVILNKAMQKNLPKYHNYNKDSLNHSIEVALIENLNDVPKEKLKNEINTSYTTKILIFTNQIPSIDGEVFDLSRNEEIFQSKTDLLFKRNLFVPTKFLSKREEYNKKMYSYESNSYIPNRFNAYEYETKTEKNIQITDSFIKEFIYQMVNKDREKSDYIINWLAYYFQNLKKTGTALVLLGDSEVTEKLFFNLIIKKIFGNRYCSTINDTEYKTSLLQDVAKYKLFFNIADIKNAGTKFDDDTLALLIKDLLIQSSVEYTNDKGDEERVEIYGQLLITASNPAPYLKKSLSKCAVIETVNIDKIMESLELEDEIELEDKILKDLDIFSDLLNNYSVKDEIAKEKFITEERKKLKGITTSNVDKNAIEDSIDKFIEAIKNKDIEYFEKVKNIDNGIIYEHLKNAFEKDDGYFIGQDILVYYNAINEQIFDNKKDLMDKLKAKDNMFLQEVKTLKILTSDKKEEVLFQAYKTSKETGNKELYKINDYVMAKDIEIPYGAVITTTQVNIKKYHHEDLGNAIKINKEYKDKKT